MNLKVKIKKLNPDLIMPSYAREGDAGFDLRALQDYDLKPGEGQIFMCGFALEFPQDFVAIVKDKGSIPKNHRVQTMGGVFDSGYRGEYNVNLINSGDEVFHISKGDKLAQIVIVPVAIAEFEEVEELTSTDRGEGRFGSTGVR